MYNSTEHQQSTGMAPSAARGTFTAFGARHVKGVAVSRWVAAVCFVVAGGVAVGVRPLVGGGFLCGGRAERLARLPGPALEPAPGCPEDRRALGVGVDMTDAGPSAARGTFTAFGARHVKGVAVSRWVAAVCFVVAAVLLLAFGHWWGAVFFVAAGLNGSLAYLVPRWNLLRDAPRTSSACASYNDPGLSWWTTRQPGCAVSSRTCTTERRPRWSLSS